MITDGLVLKKIREDNITDPSILLALEEKLDKPRILDDAPDLLKFQNKAGVTIKGGVEVEFSSHYNRLFDASRLQDQATLDLSYAGRGVKHCDYVVWATLKSLAFLGCTKYEKQAIACRDTFMAIMMVDVEYITKDTMLTILLASRTTSKGYYHVAVAEAIVETVYTEEDILRNHIQTRLCKYGLDYSRKFSIILCETFKGLTPKEFDKKIREWKKESGTKIPRGEDLRYYCDLVLANSKGV